MEKVQSCQKYEESVFGNTIFFECVLSCSDTPMSFHSYWAFVNDCVQKQMVFA